MFKFDLGLYVHAHMILSDRAYQSNDSIAGEADPEFFPANAWNIEDLKRIIVRLDQDIVGILEFFEDDHDQMGLASAAQLGRSLQAVGSNSAFGGRGLLFMVNTLRYTSLLASMTAIEIEGFNRTPSRTRDATLLRRFMVQRVKPSQRKSPQMTPT